MANEENDVTDDKQKITVEASTVDGVVNALDMEMVEPDEEEPEPSDYPEALLAVLDTINDIYDGVHEATETDSRGRSRKMVRQFADREDLSSDAVGHILRVLEYHELVVQDGNRWRIPEDTD